MIINYVITTGEEELAPYKKYEEDAGFDLKIANKDPSIVLWPNKEWRISTGIKVEIPEGYFGLIVPRSGLGSKGINLMNTVGIIDSSYRGEIFCNIVNNGSEAIELKRFDRFAQLVIIPIPTAVLNRVESLDNTERGQEGFGSTGV